MKTCWILMMMLGLGTAEAITMPPGAENLVVNGGFEDGFAGWETLGVTGLAPGYNGGTAAQLGNATAGISGYIDQTISGIQPGQFYDLSFYLRVDGQPQATRSEFLVGNGSSGTMFDLLNVDPFGWTRIDLHNLTSPYIYFAAIGAQGFYVDDISVTLGHEVPETLSTFWALAAVAAALAVLARARVGT